MIDLPWGPKIVHIHQYHEVETLLQPKTRKNNLCLTSAADGLIMHTQKKQSNFAAFPKTQLLILQLKIAIILIVYWFEVTYLESCLVPSHPFLVTAQCPWCCVSRGPDALEKLDIKHPSPWNLLFADDSQWCLGTRQSR